MKGSLIVMFMLWHSFILSGQFKPFRFNKFNIGSLKIGKNELKVVERTVKKGETLKSIIKNTYNVKYSKQDSSYLNIYNFIIDANQIINADKITVDSKILIPTILSRFRSSSVFGFSAIESWSGEATYNFKKAGVLFRTEKGISLAFQNIYRSHNFNLIMSVAGTKLATIHTKSTSNTHFVKSQLDDSLLVDLSNLPESSFNNFYIFDVVNTGELCSHGKMVEQVVEETLAHYGMSHIFKKVKTVPINYFQNPKYGDSILKVYKSKYGFDPIQLLKRSDDSCIWRIPSLKDSIDYYADKTPEVYLNMLLACVLDSLPDIITNSYTVDCTTPALSPIANDVTNYITAASNDSLPIERYYKIPQEIGALPVFREPLRSYILNQKEVGTMIVGNQFDKDHFAGMYSENGLNVTVLGKGKGWGAPDYSRCFPKNDLGGTSFATPYVATQLFIAKAFWRKNGLQINPAEARKRIMLSADLNPKFVGKFSSGGGININKLLQTGKGYLVGNDEQIIKIDSIQDAFISYCDFSDCNHLDLDFNASEILKPCGLYSTDNKVFILTNNYGGEKWSEIKSVTKISISYYVKDKLQYLNMKEFGTKYKQFVFLQN